MAAGLEAAVGTRRTHRARFLACPPPRLLQSRPAAVPSRQTIEPVVAQYYRELRAILARTLKDGHAADDVVQEACARVLALRQAGRPIEKLRAVLHRTAYNLLIDRSRRDKLRQHDSLDCLPEDAHPAAPASARPDERLDSARRARALLETIEALPPRCREAFVLHKLDGLSQPDVAAQMGISLNMVERHIMRGMDACRACRDRLDGLVRPAEAESPAGAVEPAQSGRRSPRNRSR